MTRCDRGYSFIDYLLELDMRKVGEYGDRTVANPVKVTWLRYPLIIPMTG